VKRYFGRPGVCELLVSGVAAMQFSRLKNRQDRMDSYANSDGGMLGTSTKP